MLDKSIWEQSKPFVLLIRLNYELAPDTALKTASTWLLRGNRQLQYMGAFRSWVVHLAEASLSLMLDSQAEVRYQTEPILQTQVSFTQTEGT